MTTRNDNGPQGYCGFEVGQHVVFKRDYGPRFKAKWMARGVCFPAVGKVYTIRELLIAPKTGGGPDRYVVRLFSWLDGRPTERKVVTISKLTDDRLCKLYDNEGEWRAAGEDSAIRRRNTWNLAG